jgi:hypothetical protein
MAAVLKKVRVPVAVKREAVVLSKGESALLDARRQAFDRFAGYGLGFRWKTEKYGSLRNAAWLLRNSRVGGGNNPAALRLVVHEADKLLNSRETLRDVLEAFAELLVHP